MCRKNKYVLICLLIEYTYIYGSIPIKLIEDYFYLLLTARIWFPYTLSILIGIFSLVHHPSYRPEKYVFWVGASCTLLLMLIFCVIF